MRIILGWFCILVMAVLGSSAVGAAASRKKPAAKKTATKSAKASTKKSSPKKTASKKTTSKTASKATSKKRSTTRRTTRTPARTRQAAPAPERYKEIQDALAAKGYLDPADANGAWGQSSVAALKRFQADQKIQTTGKINSLSLIALGLGPKRESAPEKPPEPPPAEVK
jgi:cytoskeletal protein RodZ